MKLYAIRHGETFWNVEHRVQGISDVPLTDRGREDASACTDLVKSLSIDTVVASPLERAVETAKILVDAVLPINTDDRIKERDWGRNEGMNINQIDKVDCWNFWLNSKENGIEPLQDFMRRVSEFLEDIKYRYPNKNVLVVAHSAVLRAIHYLLGEIPEDGDLTKIEIPNLRMIEYNI